MSTKAIEKPQWIQGPVFDSVFFGFAWVAVLLAFWLVDRHLPAAWGRTALLGVVLMVTALHRHLTFPLVYADGEQFRQRKLSYIFFPILFGVLTVSAIVFRKHAPLLMVLVIGSALWNFYHTLMQKMGILRVYARKAGPARPWVDKAMIFSWFFSLFFLLGSMPWVVKQVSGLALSGHYLIKVLTPALKVFPYLAGLSLAVSLAVSFLYAKQEFSRPEGFHWPKNLFMSSILALYGLFFYDFFIAYVAFGFSHAVEYIAFVNIYSRKKYPRLSEGSSLMARWMRRPGLSSGVYCAVILGLFIPWFLYSRPSYGYYILGTSFLHFLYDGWIWKVRKPAVGKPLGLEYAPSLPQTA